ncbi:hypothetical protein BDK51DRAFT_30950, partial [Blyttiomyces helicus]
MPVNTAPVDVDDKSAVAALLRDAAATLADSDAPSTTTASLVKTLSTALTADPRSAWLAKGLAAGTVDPFLLALLLLALARHHAAQNSPSEAIGPVHAGFVLLDAENEFHSWTLNHPETLGEDEEPLDLAVPRGGPPLAPKRVENLAAVAKAAEALAVAMTSAGNKRMGLHISLCAAAIYQRIVPDTPLVPERELRALLFKNAESALDLGELDLAVELATKLASTHEVAFAQAMHEAEDEGTSVTPQPHVDFAAHFFVQDLLARALLAFGDVEGSVFAHQRALAIAEIEAPIPAKCDIAASPELLNESLGRPAFEILPYSRKACALLRGMGTGDKTLPSEEDVRILLSSGILAYAFAIELAGGFAHASSPPVGIPGVSKFEGPPVRELLDESAGYLEEALDRASDPVKPVIALQ